VFETVLVANRGEIAVRVTRTLRRLGVRTVTVYSDADRGAPHVQAGDVAVRLGPAPAAESYLAIDRLLEAASASGAQAVHPGYGFLSESAEFARACAGAGLAWIGPTAEAIETMGDKIRAKACVAAAGVPVLPGAGEAGSTDDDLAEAAPGVGFPLMVKAAAGGGGKGMRVVRDAAALPDALAAARREARGAFGDGTLLLERYVEGPRHIEVQVLGDHHGTVVHLGERECSLQRRHQKVVEEAPSAVVDPALRERLGKAAVEAARAVDYTGAGTVEFIATADAGEFFFLEMNTRLQVEHPVTEAVTGVDLVEWQVRVAAGEPLAFVQDDVVLSGHAIEARVYAEDPARGFLPTGGRVLAAHQRAGGVRVDTGVARGSVISSDYDPMLAKVIAHGADRATALRRLDAALADYHLLGVRTNVAFLRALLAHPDVVAGRVDTGLIERELDALTRAEAAPAPDDVLIAAALARQAELEPRSPAVDPFDVPGGWRLGEPAWTRWRMVPAGARGGEPCEVRVRGRATGAEVALDGRQPVRAAAVLTGDELAVTVAGRTLRYVHAVDGEVAWLGRDGSTWAVTEEALLEAARADEDAGVAGPLVSPLPGTVVLVAVSEGEEVRAGATLLVVEAMKMEHPITAPIDGVVTALRVRQGQQVAMEQPLVVVEAVAPSREPA
jgi:acetyl-CoA/propionyl-CoA carboxylase biotin carboxyl carrier protein